MTFGGWAKKLCKAQSRHHSDMAEHHGNLAEHHKAMADGADGDAKEHHTKCHKFHRAMSKSHEAHASALSDLADQVGDEGEKIFRSVEGGASPTDGLDPELADMLKTQ
jgi:hypothetical protein